MDKKFTGFTDKNGRQICEGDKVGFWENIEPYTGWVYMTGVVRWSSWGCYIVDDVRDKEGNDLCGRFLANIRATVLTESDGENV